MQMEKAFGGKSVDKQRLGKVESSIVRWEEELSKRQATYKEKLKVLWVEMAANAQESLDLAAKVADNAQDTAAAAKEQIKALAGQTKLLATKSAQEAMIKAENHLLEAEAKLAELHCPRLCHCP